jgi:predicted cobalt transporter CbtA
MTLELLLRALKAVVEVAGFALIGQGLVSLFAGADRDRNFVYVLLRIVTSPATRFVRFIMPKVVQDRFIPVLTFGVLFWVWVGLIVAILHVRSKGL